MRRFLLPALMISLLLSGCGGAAAAERRIETQRDLFAGAERLCFTAEVTALPDETAAFVCTLACAADAAAVTVEVAAPENIAGVKAVLRDGETELEYGGVRLAVGAAGGEGVHPLSAMAMLCRALRAGHIVRAWTEKDGETNYIAAEMFVDEACDLTVWFDAASLTPLHAELSRDGAVVLRCDLRNFTYTEEDTQP